MRQLRGSIVAVLFLFSFVSTKCSFARQFSYEHEFELAFDHEQGMPMNHQINRIAFELNKNLNNSPLFDPTFLSDPEKVRQHHLKKKYLPDNEGKIYNFIIEEDEYGDEITSQMTHFDRGSDKLLVVGTGFTNSREMMSPFIDMFPDYDIVIFDFRGHGHHESSWLNPFSWSWSFTKSMFGCDLEEVGLGNVEEKDVFTVVDSCKKLKNYNQVLGLGVCYSAFILLKAACVASQNGQRLFDKIVLDSCWESLPKFIDKIKKDPKTILDPQKGGCENHWLYTSSYLQGPLFWFAENFMGLEIHDVSILDYLSHLKETELFFIYGKDDLMITRGEFETVWNTVPAGIKKTALITCHPHVRNHLKSKELYKLACELFFDENQDSYYKLLSNPKMLIDYHKRKLDLLLENQYVLKDSHNEKNTVSKIAR